MITATATSGTICPSCLSPSETLTPGPSGARICPGCRTSYEAALFPLPDPPAKLANAFTGEGASPCAAHSGNAAEVSCERCGRLMCGLCRVDSDGKALCTKCFERLASEGALPSAINRITSHYAKARMVTGASWLLYPFAMVLGPYAFYLSVRAWMDRRKSGDDEGKFAIPLIALLSALSSAMGFFFVWLVTR